MNSGMSSAFALDGFRAYASDAAAPGYDMLVNDIGDYYIIKNAVSGDVTSYTYYRSKRATEAVATAWSDRANKTYVSFEVAFGGYLRGQ